MAESGFPDSIELGRPARLDALWFGAVALSLMTTTWLATYSMAAGLLSLLVVAPAVALTCRRGTQADARPLLRLSRDGRVAMVGADAGHDSLQLTGATALPGVVLLRLHGVLAGHKGRHTLAVTPRSAGATPFRRLCVQVRRMPPAPLTKAGEGKAG